MGNEETDNIFKEFNNKYADKYYLILIEKDKISEGNAMELLRGIEKFIELSKKKGE